MNIVANTYFLKHLRNQDFFTLDLGKSRLDKDNNEFRKLDDFIIKYRSIYNRHLTKFGRIGERIKFYEDFQIDNNLYIIFNDDDIFEINYSQDDLIDIKNYILEILRKVDSFDDENTKEPETEDSIQKKIENQGDYWVANDDKNNGKKYTIDQTLSKEEYRKALAEKLSHK